MCGIVIIHDDDDHITTQWAHTHIHASSNQTGFIFNSSDFTFMVLSQVALSRQEGEMGPREDSKFQIRKIN